jgi:hypothetical protein
MDGYAEPPTKEETPKSGYVDMYNEGETADVYEKDDDGEESGYAVHDGAAPPRSSAKQGDGGKAKKAKKKEKKMKKSSKPAKKSKKATGGERDFAIDEALLKREREEQERLAKFDPYGTATSAASGAGGSSSSVYVQDESFLPFFSSAAPASAYAVPSAAAEQEDVNASAYGAADGQAPSSNDDGKPLHPSANHCIARDTSSSDSCLVAHSPGRSRRRGDVAGVRFGGRWCVCLHGQNWHSHFLMGF